MIVVGDIHGELEDCIKLAITRPYDTILQLGDFGVGFVRVEKLKKLPINLKFFVGNHDNRQLAKTIPNNIGDYGEFEGIFFVSGADSIDKGVRTEGLSWWADEELSYSQCNSCLAEWEKSKCDTIVSHDCPQSIAEKYFDIRDKTRTRQLLQAMIDARKPARVIFGHHHKTLRVTYDGIQYFGLAPNEVLKI